MVNRRWPLLWSSWLASLGHALNDPLNDFCRRFGHQTAIVDNHLFVDGGFINYKPFDSNSLNNSNPFLTYYDLTGLAAGGDMPPMYANLSKNATIPSVNGGKLWEDDVNKRIYLFGGELFNSAVPQFTLYSYDVLYDEWISHGQPQGNDIINAVSYGAGVSLSDRGEAYYYGGWMSNNSVPGWSGPPRATNRLLKYTMDKNTWSNLTGPDDDARAEGEMVFLPMGDAGFLVYFGGSKDLYGNGTVTPQPLDEIFLFDVANTKWYKQKTSGRTPENRRLFCGGATWAKDQSSYNIYIYGGHAYPPDTTGYDDIYILTIPSFQWIRGPYPPNSNVTGAFPKSMMSCNVVKNAQMLVIGGTYSNDSTACDADVIWGTHNMNLGEENPNKAIWAAYQPNLTTYTVPTDLVTAIGGNGDGQATVTAPPTGFDAPDLAVLATRKAKSATRTPTRFIPGPTSTSKPPKDKLGKGALAGIVIGAVVGVALLGLAGFCIFRRLRKNKPGPTPELQGGTPQVHQHQYQQYYHDPQNPAAQQYGPSPTLTTPSYVQAPTQYPPPPAVAPTELPTSGMGSYVGSDQQAYYDQNRGFSPGAKSVGSYHARQMSHELEVSPRADTTSPTVTAGAHSPNPSYPESYAATPVGYEGYPHYNGQQGGGGGGFQQDSYQQQPPR